MTRLRQVEVLSGLLVPVFTVVIYGIALWAPLHTVTDYYPSAGIVSRHAVSLFDSMAGGSYLPWAILLAVAFLLLSVAVAISVARHTRDGERAAWVLWLATALLLVGAFVGLALGLGSFSTYIVPSLLLAVIASACAVPAHHFQADRMAHN